MNMVRCGVFGMLAVLALVLGGCQTDEPGVSNELGTVQKDLPASPPAVVEAARATLEELDLEILAAEADELGGRVRAESALDEVVQIWVRRRGEQRSRVHVRIGTFGDQEQSVAILRRIEARLE